MILAACVGPAKLVLARYPVEIMALCPDTSRFDPRFKQPIGQGTWRMIQSVDAYRYHDASFFTRRIAHSFQVCKGRASSLKTRQAACGQGCFHPTD